MYITGKRTLKNQVALAEPCIRSVYICSVFSNIKSTERLKICRIQCICYYFNIFCPPVLYTRISQTAWHWYCKHFSLSHENWAVYVWRLLKFIQHLASPGRHSSFSHRIKPPPPGPPQPSLKPNVYASENAPKMGTRRGTWTFVYSNANPFLYLSLLHNAEVWIFQKNLTLLAVLWIISKPWNRT